jgi:hypothetical protein
VDLHDDLRGGLEELSDGNASGHGGWLATTVGVRVMARPGGTEQNPNKTYGVE